MTLYVSAGLAASLVFGLGMVWFGWMFRTEAGPDGAWPLLRLYLLTYAAACVVGLFARWSFSARASDGAVVGLFIWIAAACIEAANDAVLGRRHDFSRARAAFWLIALPVLGSVMVFLDRYAGGYRLR